MMKKIITDLNLCQIYKKLKKEKIKFKLKYSKYNNVEKRKGI